MPICLLTYGPIYNVLHPITKYIGGGNLSTYNTYIDLSDLHRYRQFPRWTVLGIAPVTAAENYTVVPIVLSASCKKETGEQLGEWVDNFITDYFNHPVGTDSDVPAPT